MKYGRLGNTESTCNLRIERSYTDWNVLFGSILTGLAKMLRHLAQCILIGAGLLLKQTDVFGRESEM